MKELINRIYDRLFKENRGGKEWNYEDKLVKRKILQTKNTGTPPDLLDPIEVRYYDMLINQVRDLVGRTSFSKMKIAEFGSGTGILSIRMAKQGGKLYLIDILPSCLQYARMVADYLRGKGKFLGSVDYINKNFMDLENKEKYDLVHSIGIVEHFDDKTTLKMIQKMANCTKKGGKVVVGVPNYFSPDMINIWRVSAKGDEHFISKSDLRGFLTKAGLRDVHVETSTFFYPSFVPLIIVKHSIWLETFLGKTCGMGFLVLGKGIKV